MRPPRPRHRRGGGLGVGALAVTLLIAGCTAGPPPASPSPTASKPAETATAPTPSLSPPPSVQPDGSAQDNLPIFRSVTEAVWATSDRGSGRAYIDALVTAGFDKSAMQVTNDTTTIGDPAESIQFSVAWNDGRCLVGQVGPATGAAVTAVLPALGDGSCLLGQTRPIDW